MVKKVKRAILRGKLFWEAYWKLETLEAQGKLKTSRKSETRKRLEVWAALEARKLVP